MKRLSKVIRIAPSGHMRAMHSLINQYIVACYNLEERLHHTTFIPFMDLRKKITGYHNLDDKFYEENIWNRYFVQQPVDDNQVFYSEEVSSHTDYSILLTHLNTIELVNRFHNILKKYLVYKDYILQKVESFVQNNFNGRVASIHIRGGDSFYDKGRPHLPLSYYKDLIHEKLTDYDTIFVSSDCVEYVDYIKHNVNRTVVFYDTQNRVNLFNYKKPIHEYPIDPFLAGEEVIIESLILSHSDLLIRGQSNITTVAYLHNPTMKLHQIDLPLLSNDFYHMRVTDDTVREHMKKNYYHKHLEVKNHEEYLVNAIEFKKKQFSILDEDRMSYKLEEIIKEIILK